MLTERIEKRTEERVPAGLRVMLGRHSGVTRDVSASALYLQTDASLSPGQSVTFAVEIETAAGKIALWCHGRVLRTDDHGPLQGVAVRILESTLRADAIPVAAAGT
jgi:hypothetical protein